MWNYYLRLGLLVLLVLFFVSFVPVQAAILYVWTNSPNPSSPYNTWTNSARDIQTAINAATDGDTVLVTNGVYATGGVPNYPSGTSLTNRVAITKPIAVRSVNGPSVTSIMGTGPIGDRAVRCVYLSDGAILEGFTLTNGATRNISAEDDGYGGGAWLSTGAIVSNCIFSGNEADRGGGAAFGTLYNCTFSGNASTAGGGAYESTLYNCMLSGNSAYWGGGAVRGTLYSCILSSNWAAPYDGGGTYFSTLYNCTFTDNWATGDGGGPSGGTLYNCMLSGNSANNGGGAAGCTLYNCTVSSNEATTYGGGVYKCQTLVNSIVYFNSAPAGGNWYDVNIASNCCATPQLGGPGNITSEPSFIDMGTGNYRLQPNSPCINTGTNQAWMFGALDLDGNPRIIQLIVDMGAYEYQGPGEILVAGANGATIPNGAEADLEKGTDYGMVQIGMAITNSFSITNSGVGILTIMDVTTNNTGLCAFDVLTMPKNVSAGMESNFTVRFLPLSRGVFTAAVAIVSTATNTPYILHFKGTGDGFLVQVTSTYGSPNPPTGEHTYKGGSIVTNVLDGSPVEGGPGTQYVCSGWALTGHEPESGTSTDFTMVVTNNAVLTWLWQTNVYLQCDGGGRGTINGLGDGWYVLGSSVTVTAVPNAGFVFSGWVGDVSISQQNQNPITLTMDQTRSIQALFKGTYYVSASSGSDMSDGLSWTQAKLTIQAAVNETMDGDTVIVSNGIYRQNGAKVSGLLTNRVAITQAITVRSANGPKETIIEGVGPIGNAAVRGVYLGSNATLIGFTITNGHTRQIIGETINDRSAGGILAMDGARIQQCIIAGNQAEAYAGGVYGGQYINSLIYANRAFVAGGAANASLSYCTIMLNTASDQGGGTYDSTVSDSIIYDNIPDNMSGGSASYCCTIPNLGGTGNFTNRPDVVNAEALDFRLSFTSACVNAAQTTGNNVDLVGTPRPQPRRYGETPWYDVGAYEFYPVARFVWTNGNDRPPYGSWSEAALTIQSAVNASGNGDLIMVMDGIYCLGSTILITNNITIKSLNGAGKTVIDAMGLVRGVDITGPSAVLDGFTVMNGSAGDCGGISADNGAVVRDCIIRNNMATYLNSVGGGVCVKNGAQAINCQVSSNRAVFGGGVYANMGIVNQCGINGNSGDSGSGGGAYLMNGSSMDNSIIEFNTNQNAGGVYVEESSLQFCRLMGNRALMDGGAVYMSRGQANNLVLEQNSSARDGAGLYITHGFVYNSLVVSNIAVRYGGGVYMGATGTIFNMTVVTNSAGSQGGGIYMANYGTLWNTISYFNSAPLAPNLYVSHPGLDIHYVCTTPMVSGLGNISGDPLFMAGGNYHITAASPCLDTGSNQDWMTTAVDIDMQGRVYNNVVDIGADEAVVEAASIHKTNTDLNLQWNVVKDARLQLFSTTNVSDPVWMERGDIMTGTVFSITTLVTNVMSHEYFRLDWLK